ncbi:MAG: arginine deiminase-related protein [Pseudomonadota bacterium]
MSGKQLRSMQAPAAVVMIRPHRFLPNPQTAHDNAFQRGAGALGAAALAAAAHAEAGALAEALARAGVRVHLFEDEGGPHTPDSVFPNNWFSTHAGGHVALYPMFSPNRRHERRADIIEMLKASYRVQDVIDYSGLEADGLFLEGTGAMVLDHVERTAYVVQSKRASAVALERFCTHFNFEPIAFEAADNAGRPVYHTNVMLCIGTAFALIAPSMIGDPLRRAEVLGRLAESGRAVIVLSESQVGEFAANAIELSSPAGPVLAMSSRALAALDAGQRAAIEASARILAMPVPTIELAGGSVRCMLAGIHLAPRAQPAGAACM